MDSLHTENLGSYHVFLAAKYGNISPYTCKAAKE